MIAKQGYYKIKIFYKMSLSIAKFFSKKKTYPTESVAEIGPPTNVSHQFHVSKNAETGQLEGLPDPWIRLLNAQLSKSEQNEHPAAALQAIKFYNYSIKRKPQEEVFKPFVTEDLIAEESQEIDKILAKKKYNSADSDGSTSRSSSDSSHIRVPELPPKLGKAPKPTPRKIKTEERAEKTLTEILEDLNSYQIEDDRTRTLVENNTEEEIAEQESPILRRKTDNNVNGMTDEEVFDELRRELFQKQF